MNLKRRYIGERVDQHQPILQRKCSGCGESFTCNGECGIKGKIKSENNCYCPLHLRVALEFHHDFNDDTPTANCRSRGF